MARIKSRRGLVVGVFTLALSVTCVVLMITGQLLGWRVVITIILGLALAAINLYTAFTGKGGPDDIEASEDERDRYVYMKSSQKTLEIGSYVMGIGCATSFVLYGAFRLPVFIAITAALGALSIILGIIFLCAIAYYDKRA